MIYRKGCDIIDPHFPESEVLDFPKTTEEARLMEEAIHAAKQAEVVVMVLGGNELTVREDRSRTSLNLPGRQEELLKAVCATGKPVVFSAARRTRFFHKLCSSPCTCHSARLVPWGILRPSRGRSFVRRL